MGILSVAKRRVVVFGAGNIGVLIAALLADSQAYEVVLVDKQINPLIAKLALSDLKFLQLDVTDKKAVEQCLQENSVTAIISCLPYFCNIAMAEMAKKLRLHYFDLTEDIEVAEKIAALAQGEEKVFVPQCGLAPGFINIVANDLMQKFDKLETVKLRAGNLPSSTSHALKYALTWSLDGLINEYGNECLGIVEGHKTILQPLQNLESVEIDGVIYEAFNTSGGIGSLVDSYFGKVNNLNYKTLRYPGHCGKIRFLMQDLKLEEDRETLKRILENSLPRSYQDVVIVYVSVTGTQNKHVIEENYVKKFYPQLLFNKHWSAIQITTASGICSVVDLVLQQPEQFHEFVRQEQIALQKILENRFGKLFAG